MFSILNVLYKIIQYLFTEYIYKYSKILPQLKHLWIVFLTFWYWYRFQLEMSFDLSIYQSYITCISIYIRKTHYVYTVEMYKS